MIIDQLYFCLPLPPPVHCALGSFRWWHCIMAVSHYRDVCLIFPPVWFVMVCPVLWENLFFFSLFFSFFFCPGPCWTLTLSCLFFWIWNCPFFLGHWSWGRTRKQRCGRTISISQCVVEIKDKRGPLTVTISLFPPSTLLDDGRFEAEDAHNA